MLLGERVASELGIGGAQAGHEITVGDARMRVAGILEDAPHQSALAPAGLQSVSLKLPADPRSLRASLMADAEQTTLIITVVMVVVSIFTVVNTMQIAIAERRREIGISLALGMPAWHIAAQFLLEAMLLGFCGGFAGMAVGSLMAAVLAMGMGWPFMLPWTVLLVPVAGAMAGAVGGVVPVVQATRIDPAELLRATDV